MVIANNDGRSFRLPFKNGQFHGGIPKKDSMHESHLQIDTSWICEYCFHRQSQQKCSTTNLFRYRNPFRYRAGYFEKKPKCRNSHQSASNESLWIEMLVTAAIDSLLWCQWSTPRHNMTYVICTQGTSAPMSQIFCSNLPLSRFFPAVHMI